MFLSLLRTARAREDRRPLYRRILTNRRQDFLHKAATRTIFFVLLFGSSRKNSRNWKKSLLKQILPVLKSNNRLSWTLCVVLLPLSVVIIQLCFSQVPRLEPGLSFSRFISRRAESTTMESSSAISLSVNCRDVKPSSLPTKSLHVKVY
ncbi:hypothetical protein M3Y97_00936900 [Aphelenchoides bicaudatus]|nr:hypothetical protein M3Y97_00936900 [Aphelenchoides bicaudatus]